jgi:hypothetical protein
MGDTLAATTVLVFVSASRVMNLPFTSDIPVTTSSAPLTATTGNTAPTTSAPMISTNV